MNITTVKNEPFQGFTGKIIDFFSELKISIQSKLLASFLIVIILIVAVNSMMILNIIRFNRQYDAIITNITTANSINGYIKPAIDTEMWNIVAGKVEFEKGNQYQIIDQVNDQIDMMIMNTDSDKSKIKLDVIRRTMNTLKNYVDKMGEQMANNSRVSENELVLENIRGVSDVVEESVQEYMLFEVNQAEMNYLENKANFNRLAVMYLILLPCTVGFSMFAAWFISASIYVPIRKLNDITTTITKNDLQALVNSENSDEISELGQNFNIMINRIREMLNAKVKEQEILQKAELKALQAQINPHFLYNTLDTIVWMAEANDTAQVKKIVRALTSFFRIALSKGKDWISIREEIEHVRSYLIIQKMRYRDILNYRIEVDDDLLDGTILKLTLQPLVENAIYHGIKNKRDGGTIVVRAQRVGDNLVRLEVQDDGVGFTPQKLAQIRASLSEDGLGEITMKEEGFGLENVNKRIKLYFGKEYGLYIQSKYREGTQVVARIPLKNSIEVAEEQN